MHPRDWFPFSPRDGAFCRDEDTEADGEVTREPDILAWMYEIQGDKLIEISAEG